MATTIYEAIRSSLIALLKGRWPAFDVFGEGIDKTQEAGQTELEDYIYLDIIPFQKPARRPGLHRPQHPGGRRDPHQGREQSGVPADQPGAGRSAAPSIPIYRQRRGQGGDHSRPGLNIVDKVLHATFTLAFRDSIEEPEAPPLMAELESNIRTNQKE